MKVIKRNWLLKYVNEWGGFIKEDVCNDVFSIVNLYWEKKFFKKFRLLKRKINEESICKECLLNYYFLILII